MPDVRFLDPDIATWIRQREIPARTEGPHVSRVITSMLKTMDPKKYAAYGTAVDGQREGAFELGYTWEDVLSNTLRDRLVLDPRHTLMPPQEISRDGIYGTPDRVIHDRGESRWILEELKLTWYSCNGLTDTPEAILENVKFTYWTLQLKTYAAMLLHHRPADDGSGLIVPAPKWGAAPTHHPICRIRAFFLNGTYRYKDGDRAKPLCWEIRWHPVELEQWWAAVVRHVQRMETNSDGPEPATT